jgi:hypothetical protein
MCCLWPSGTVSKCLVQSQRDERRHRPRNPRRRYLRRPRNRGRGWDAVGLAGVVRDGELRELYWVSYPGARHSQNIAVRPQIAMVVFDRTVPAGTGQGVYMSATAE